MISIGRHFIEFVLLWKFFYQTILWCTFIYNLVWPRIALFNGTSVPIELLITHLKEHYMVHLIFFEKDFQANLLVVKITLRTSSTSSEKNDMLCIGQKLPCQWIEETLVPENGWTFHPHWRYVVDATWALSIPADFWQGLCFTG